MSSIFEHSVKRPYGSLIPLGLKDNSLPTMEHRLHSDGPGEFFICRSSTASDVISEIFNKSQKHETHHLRCSSKLISPFNISRLCFRISAPSRIAIISGWKFAGYLFIISVGIFLFWLLILASRVSFQQAISNDECSISGSTSQLFDDVRVAPEGEFYTIVTIIFHFQTTRLSFMFPHCTSCARNLNLRFRQWHLSPWYHQYYVNKL